MHTEKLISLKECEARTGIKTDTWRLWVKRGAISAYKLGGSVRVSESDLEEFIRAGHVATRTPKAEQAVGAQ